MFEEREIDEHAGGPGCPAQTETVERFGRAALDFFAHLALRNEQELENGKKRRRHGACNESDNRNDGDRQPPKPDHLAALPVVSGRLDILNEQPRESDAHDRDHEAEQVLGAVVSARSSGNHRDDLAGGHFFGLRDRFVNSFRRERYR